MVHDNEQSTLKSWFPVIISSTACIIGASIVYIDRILPSSIRRHGSILTNHSFLAASMALASGVLLFSSLSILLPASQKRLGSVLQVYCFFFAGVIFTFVLTKIVHWCTPDAVHACGGPPAPALPKLDEEEAAQETRLLSSSHRAAVAGREDQSQTTTADGGKGQQHYGAVLFSEAHFRYHPSSTPGHHHQHHHLAPTDEEDESDTKVQFLRIGIQTAVAICVHKFPEGLIMFVSSRASKQMGWSIAAAMSIHNLTEGFMIALPLYFALRSKSTAFGWAAVLGGLSQPIGAALGLLLIRNVQDAQEDKMFGIVFGLISGMMSLISVQSMLPQAIKADTEHRFVVTFFFLGILLVSLTSVLESLS